MAFVLCTFAALHSRSNKQSTCSFSSGRSSFVQRSACTRVYANTDCASRLELSMVSPSTTGNGKLAKDKDPSKVGEEEWRQVLTEEEFNVLRGKGTEYPGTGEYDSFYPSEGHFICRACGNPLYSAEAKFKSGCGWPAFDKCYENAIKTEIDMSFGGRRIEIMCNKCDGHLGHVFEGEGFTETNERHCVNSVSVKYVEGKFESQEGKLM